ncbi:MAG: hypothetical protein K8F36_08540, partial [Melioribacteraceae bacterium]|nr:hypothetical protein [Melioribacteraceae bacterium]
MKKAFMLFLALCIISISIYSQETTQKLDVTTKYNPNPSGEYKSYPLPYTPKLLELYNNGPVANSIGTGAGGADESILESVTLGMNTLGFGHQFTLGNSMADDFTVPGGQTWTVDEVIFFAYQTNSTTTSTMTGAYFQIWDGDPSLGGASVIYGDLVTNVMTDTYFSNVYRVSETTLGATNRPIMEVVCDGGFVLGPGTYWIEWTVDGSLASGPWAPPIAILGQATTGNALQNIAGTWGPAQDSGTLTQQGLPFIFIASEGPGEATNPFPADGTFDIPQAGTTLTWDNPAGTSYNQVYFGDDETLVTARDVSTMVLDGSVTKATIYEEYETGELEYGTTYYWVVDETETAKTPGISYGDVWSFQTEPEYPQFLWVDNFESGTDNWDIYGTGVCDWYADSPPWDASYQLPPEASGVVMVANSDDCGSGTNTNTYLEMNKGVDLSNFGNTVLLFDADQNDLSSVFEVDVSTDGGITWMNIFSEAGIDRRSAEMELLVPEADFQADVRFRFHYVAEWDWWWAIDNVTIFAETPLTTMYGYLMHPNENPITNTDLRLESDDPAKYIFEATTDGDGWFEFIDVPPATFWLSIIGDYPAYTLDTRDAFLVSKQANKTEPYPTGDMFFVSDVTADGEVRWNDAVMIFERMFGDIDAFNRPDWLGTYGNEAFVHGGSDMDMGIMYAWLAGDADWSYGNTLRSLKMLEVTKSGSRSLAIGSEVSVPYYVTSDAEVSAAMMRFNYSDKYEFVGLDSKLANATVINGEGFVGIMYIDKPVNF